MSDTQTQEPTAAAPAAGAPSSSQDAGSNRSDNVAYFAIAFAALAVITAVFSVGLAVRAVQRADKIENSPAAAAGGSSQPVKVALTEFAFTPKAITVAANGSVELTNGGTTSHDFTVAGINSGNIEAGDSKTVSLAGLEPGDYEVICNIPGHKEAGMVASLKIT